MRSCFAFVAAGALSACALLSDVTPIGPDTFMASAHSNDVNASIDGQRAAVMRRATSYCGERGAALDVIRVVAEAPPPGRPPSAEVDFRCRKP